jgi:hypothetical protein
LAVLYAGAGYKLLATLARNPRRAGVIGDQKFFCGASHRKKGKSCASRTDNFQRRSRLSLIPDPWHLIPETLTSVI